jgi:hypothetical protein
MLPRSWPGLDWNRPAFSKLHSSDPANWPRLIYMAAVIGIL